jgi:hypothetical protein
MGRRRDQGRRMLWWVKRVCGGFKAGETSVGNFLLLFVDIGWTLAFRFLCDGDRPN